MSIVTFVYICSGTSHTRIYIFVCVAMQWVLRIIDGACRWCIYWGLKMELVYVVPRSLDILICTSGIHLTHLIVTYIYIHIHTYTQCIYCGLCHSACVWDDRCCRIHNTIYLQCIMYIIQCVLYTVYTVHWPTVYIYLQCTLYIIIIVNIIYSSL